MRVDLSLPVIWSDDGAPALPGRLDVCPGELRLEGGHRDELRRRVVTLAEIAGIRIGRRPGERLAGRAALMLDLRDGSRVAFAGFAGPGTLHELAERLLAATGLEPPADPEPA